MNAMTKLRYPSTPEIKRIVNAAKACGLDVGGIEVCPDGMIRILEARATQQGQTLFDRLRDQL
ncbi:hypothetical protein U1769_17975 [Sphingomonas sp. ZT3P38]|uniref:hypothetical protein n=1 Tax=Parasphingomonas zepuensis TaxID=3096161 RepID=UPI002FCB31B9